MDQQEKSILEMAHGAFLERTTYEMRQIIANIRDANTNPTAKRKMTLTMTFLPDEERRDINMLVDVKIALAPTKSMRTTLSITGEDSRGVPRIVEMRPVTPGQLDMFGGEEPPQAVLRMAQEIINGNVENF